MKKGKYIITGCAGFIGSHLVNYLFKDYDIILVDDLSEGSRSKLPKLLQKKLIKRSIQDIKSFNYKGIKGIFHLAAQSSVQISINSFYKSSTNNLNSSLKVFEIAKKFSIPVVYASSSAVYGNLSVGDDVKNNLDISSPYAQDKLALENYARTFFKNFKISSVGLRLFNVYGPNQNANSPYSAVIPIFIDRMKKNASITINGGYQTRDFIYIEDILNIMKFSMQLAQSKKNSIVVNVGTGRSVNINYLFKIIGKSIPNNSKIIRKKLDEFDPKKSSGKFIKFKKFFKNKNIKFTKLEDGLLKTIRSY